MKRIGTSIVLLCFICMLLPSCTIEPKKIILGKDNCDFCKMTVSDPRYAAEILTKKGKVYIFDDLHCMIGFIKAKSIVQESVKDFYVSDFIGDHSLIKVNSCYLFSAGELHSPMGGNTAAFINKDSMQKMLLHLSGDPVSWKNLIK